MCVLQVELKVLVLLLIALDHEVPGSDTREGVGVPKKAHAGCSRVDPPQKQRHARAPQCAKVLTSKVFSDPVLRQPRSSSYVAVALKNAELTKEPTQEPTKSPRRSPRRAHTELTQSSRRAHAEFTHELAHELAHELTHELTQSTRRVHARFRLIALKRKALS